MIILKVEVNGEVVANAGKDDLCVLSTIIGATGILGPKSRGTDTEKQRHELRLNIGGLGVKSDEDPGTHYDWIGPTTLNVGDEVKVSILDGDSVDSPKKENRKIADQLEDQQKKHWEVCKEVYLEFKEKYE